jgi:predicted MFS family arabinose efflux permease
LGNYYPEEERDQLKVKTRLKGGSLLLLISTLVARLAKQFTVLLLRHALAALLDNRTH